MGHDHDRVWRVDSIGAGSCTAAREKSTACRPESTSDDPEHLAELDTRNEVALTCRNTQCRIISGTEIEATLPRMYDGNQSCAIHVSMVLPPLEISHHQEES
jgi:hypothetical protein